MTFEEYKSTIGVKKYPFSSLLDLLDEENNEMIKLDQDCLQKIDWIQYCIDHGDVKQISLEELDDTLKMLIDYFEVAANYISNAEDCFSASGGLYSSFFKLCKDSLEIDQEKRQKMDDLLLNNMVNVFKELYKNGTIPFHILLSKVQSWFVWRQEFCFTAQVGFSPLEYYILNGFYVNFQDKILALRCTDFISIKTLAEYSLWLYNNAKLIPRPYMVGDMIKFNKFAILLCRNALVAAQCNGYFEYIDPIKKKIRNIQSDVVTCPTVFISYNWGKQELVNELQKRISLFANVKRDVNELGFGDSLTEFMNRIRREDFALVVISDAYLKSEACMYELTTLFKDKGADNFTKKVLFVVCEDARAIFSANGRMAYTHFWEKKYNELVRLQNGLAPEVRVESDQNIRAISYIRLQIGEFLDYVSSVKDLDEKTAVGLISSIITERNALGRIGRTPIEDFLITVRNHITSTEEIGNEAGKEKTTT